MDEKRKELIAIVAAIAGHYQPCPKYHIGRTRELGVGMDQIRKAIDVGRKVEKGAMAARRDFSREVLGEPVNRSFVCCADRGDAGPRSRH